MTFRALGLNIAGLGLTFLACGIMMVWKGGAYTTPGAICLFMSGFSTGFLALAAISLSATIEAIKQDEKSEPEEDK